MKNRRLSELTNQIVQQNEQAIQIRAVKVKRYLAEIEELRKQSRSLIGRNEK